MTKRKSKPPSPTAWIDRLDPDEIEAAYDEATTDAYGDDEQHTGLLNAIGDEVAFPFSAKVMGQVVQIVRIQWPNADEFGLDLIAESDGGRLHRIAAQSVELIAPLPEGAAFLAAYLDWKRRF